MPKINPRVKQSTIDTLLKQKDQSYEYSDIIKDRIQTYIDYTKNYLRQLSVISAIEDNDIKEKRFEKFEKSVADDLELIEYLSNPDTDLYKDIKIIESLRHNYYKIQNACVKIKNDIVLKKLEIYENKTIDSERKLSKLETRIEGMGGTVISIILSISVITSIIVAIEKIELKFVPFLVFSIVWFGMTYLLFVHCLFKKDDKTNRTALILYMLITFIWIVSMFFSFRPQIIELIEWIL